MPSDRFARAEQQHRIMEQHGSVLTGVGKRSGKSMTCPFRSSFTELKPRTVRTTIRTRSKAVPS